MIFAVLDTNVLISAALAHNKYSIPYSVFRGVVERRFVPLVDDNIVREYWEVFSRPKFSFMQETINDIVGNTIKFAINQPVPSSGVELPDSDDVVFYDVAKAHQDKCAYLVTGNLKHFPMVNDNSVVYDPTGLLAALHEAQRQAHEHGVDNLTEEEIEAEIKAARAERKKKLGL